MSFISYEGKSESERTYFFGTSQDRNDRFHLNQRLGNPYDSNPDLGKSIMVVADDLARYLPQFCYLRLNTVECKLGVNLVHSADLVIPELAKTRNQGIMSRKEFAVPETIRVMNGRTRIGNLDATIVMYQMRLAGVSADFPIKSVNTPAVFFESFMIQGDKSFLVMPPIFQRRRQFYPFGVNDPAEDYYYSLREVID